MIKVTSENLKEGMILAEAILDERNNKMLFDKNHVLKPENIQAIKNWKIEKVRIREEFDTDESIQEQILLDQMMEEEQKITPAQRRQDAPVELGLTDENVHSMLEGAGDKKMHSKSFEKSKPVRQFAGVTVKIGSLMSKEKLTTYLDYAGSLTRLFQLSSVGKDKFFMDIIELSSQLTGYIDNTTGVIGYCMYNHKKSIPELIRHTISVAIISGKIAKLMRMSVKDTINVVLAAVLHDIGRSDLCGGDIYAASIPISETTDKTQHVAKALAFLKDKVVIKKEVLLGIAQHHERMDGSGYPIGSKGDSISLIAKIIGFANKVDWLMHGNGTAQTVTLSELIRQIPYLAIHYDANVCKVFQAYMEDFLLVNRVMLDDGRQAEVIYRHQCFKEPVILTADGEFVDLNKTNLKIEEYGL